MRALVFLLILANLLFFAYAQGYLGASVSPDALRLAQQIHPERLRILPAGASDAGQPGAVPAPATPAPPDIASPAPSPAPSSPSQPSAPPPPTPVPARAGGATAQACLLLAGLSDAEAQRLASLAEQAGLTPSRRSEGGWWVFIPPQPDKKGAEKKAGELQRLGVAEFFIVSDGPQKYAISLGVFSREEAAHKYLEQLRGKGVRSARVGPRQVEGARQQLEVRGAAAELSDFRKALPAESAPRDCP